MEDWNKLDKAAKSSLTTDGFAKYEAYKAELQAAGPTWEEIKDVLTGFIWDNLEAEEVEEVEDE